MQPQVSYPYQLHAATAMTLVGVFLLHLATAMTLVGVFLLHLAPLTVTDTRGF